MNLRVNFAETLRAARDRQHLSQAELAEQLGVSTRTVQNWEAGTWPRPSHRRMLVEFLAEPEPEVAA